MSGDWLTDKHVNAVNVLIAAEATSNPNGLAGPFASFRETGVEITARRLRPGDQYMQRTLGVCLKRELLTWRY